MRALRRQLYSRKYEATTNEEKKYLNVLDRYKLEKPIERPQKPDLNACKVRIPLLQLHSDVNSLPTMKEKKNKRSPLISSVNGLPPIAIRWSKGYSSVVKIARATISRTLSGTSIPLITSFMLWPGVQLVNPRITNAESNLYPPIIQDPSSVECRRN